MSVAAPVLDPSARCLGCGYLLRGLTTACCPECGRTFEPSDIMSVDVPERRRRIWRRRLLRLVPILVWAVICYGVSWLIVTWIGWRSAGQPVVLIPGILVAGSARAYVRRRLLREDRDPNMMSERIFAFVSYAFCALVTVGSYRSDVCPHAWYYEVGPVGIACNHRNDPNGHGPCGNHASWSSHVVGRWYVYHQ